MAQLLDSGIFSAVTIAGAIGVGWKLNFYITGTSTRKDTYPTNADALAGTNANANPVVVGAAGRLPPIWFASGQAKCVLTDELDVVKATIDPVNDGTLATLAQFALDQPYNVMEAIPDSSHAAIRAGTVTADLKSYFDTAATTAVTTGRPLYIPRGTYTMSFWQPPANLEVLTAGFATVLKQTTGQASTRFIQVLVDNVRLWPGGACTIKGNIATDTSQFNSGVRVYAGAGITINRFECGDIYALNLRGDGLETGSAATGTLVHCDIGTIYVDNVYRNGLSVTAGQSGHVDGVIQIGGCGYLLIDFEPDPTSTAMRSWDIGQVKGHRVSIVGDPAVNAGSVTIAGLELDYTMAASTPPFNEGGVSAAGAPYTFESGFRWRNAKSITVAHARIVGFPRESVYDIGSGGGDTPTERVYFGYLELSGGGQTNGYEIILEKTYNFEIGFLRRSFPGAATVGVFRSSNAINRIHVGGGQMIGKVIYSALGNFAATDLTIAGDNREIFKDSSGRIDLKRVTLTSGLDLFDNCTGTIVAEDCSLAATNLIVGTTAQARYLRSTINSVFYDDGWAVATAAVASAAAIALPKTGDVILISGTTNITSITADAGHNARQVTLVFQDVLTFTDGNNLKLAGNLVTTADDTITIATPDGTTWYETGRSVN